MTTTPMMSTDVTIRTTAGITTDARNSSPAVPTTDDDVTAIVMSYNGTTGWNEGNVTSIGPWSAKTVSGDLSAEASSTTVMQEIMSPTYQGNETVPTGPLTAVTTTNTTEIQTEETGSPATPSSIGSQTTDTSVTTDTVSTTSMLYTTRRETTTMKQTTTRSPSPTPVPEITSSEPWTDNSTEGGPGSAGLSQNAIIGIAVGCAAFVIVLVIIVVVVIVMRKRSSKRSSASGDDNINDYRLEIRAIRGDACDVNGGGKEEHGPVPFKSFFSQVDNHGESPRYATSPTGTANPSYVGPTSRSSDVCGDDVIKYADADTDASVGEDDEHSSVSRQGRDNNFNDRALLAQSRISIGPVLLDGEDYSTAQAYDKMFSTNTFK